MSAIQHQIEGVYIRHTAWLTDGGFITCWCGRDNLTITEHAKHFAELLVSELGLTEIVEQDSEPGSPRWRHYASPREQVVDRQPTG